MCQKNWGLEVKATETQIRNEVFGSKRQDGLLLE